MKRIYILILPTFLMLSAFSCGTNNKTNGNGIPSAVIIPDFDADSAYQYIKTQTDFGPRTPNSESHVACGEYLAEKLKSYGAVVINQYADLTTYDGILYKARNIIGSFQPENKKRILLCAHWDTRPWADNDPDRKNHHTPILGANDGASGVGVLLEIARLVDKQDTPLGIDIIFFDAEDCGAPQFYNGIHKDEYWCLGSQYWARYPHVERYNARFGILLDMVGGKNATFYKEAYSEEFARGINARIWKKAKELGYKHYFVNEQGSQVTDDHVFINRIARIPCIDIIPCDNESKLSVFGSFWHTVNDNMNIIDKSTLKAVGQTVLAVIYNDPDE
ncbi:MAG: M28 family peptidase [Mediterranea sp.]|nr:M28 family peptidase [Mediterranea sp.]